ncbi:hypothetical protein MD588_13850 [Photobacterium sp. SDRW27]|uniref:hypothetical protein n=1 Tax=Photobacterium obscurum TaxID=2829490 RepID=UPI002243183B|nr:hypothetical protein [Photobacterium obscurum]MCW8329890.1 hypothetical protein [Photobacterium obscurum]
MTSNTSFSKLEKNYAPDFRNKINMARSTNDVYDVFCYTVASMFNEITESKKFRESDIDFYPERECHYELGVNLRREPLIVECLDTSDLGRIIGDMAQTATNRHTHLLKHPEKTNSKIMRH